MTLLEPSNPARIARRLQGSFAAIDAVDELSFARVVELSRLFASVRVIAELIESDWLLRVTDAATQALAELPMPEPPRFEVQVALRRVFEEIRAVVDTLAEGGAVEAHDNGLRVATAMLSGDDEREALSDLDLFVGNAIRDLEVTRHALARLAADPTDRSAVARAFRAVHSVRGDAGVMGARALEEVCGRLETMFEALRSDEAVATTGIVEACRTMVDHAVEAVEQPGGPLDTTALDELAARLDEGRSLAKATRLGELLVNQQMVDEHDLELALAIKSGPVGRTLVNLRAIGDDELDSVLELQRELRREGAVKTASSATHVRRASVSEDTLRDLTRAVRELQSRVVDLTTIPLVHEVVRLTEQLQRQTLGTLFRKLARAARALAEELGKEVWVSVAGAGIELHRDLVDALDRPLLQLVRNALDHGIERPPVRQVAGKPARATLTVAAKLDGNRVVIEVADDGAGIDVARVLQRAIDMGLVSPGEGTRLSDAEVQALIFEPGLSSADGVGRISGRGVGMDVVQNSVFHLGGQITVESHRGLGTRFRLVVPQRR